MIYFDTSAALKLVVPEPETTALELWIAERSGMPRVSSRLLRIEMLRAITRSAPHRMSRANVVLAAVALLSIDDVAPAAESLGDSLLRSLDAIHLATANAIRQDLTAFVCYDKRLCDSAQAIGLPVESPSLRVAAWRIKDVPERTHARGGAAARRCRRQSLQEYLTPRTWHSPKRCRQPCSPCRPRNRACGPTPH
jgi:predicted nucleic acid-binding protein